MNSQIHIRIIGPLNYFESSGNIQELWDIRNKYEHGEDSSQKAHLAREKLLNELKAVYADKANVLATDRDMF